MINPNPPKSSLQDVCLNQLGCFINFFLLNSAHFHSDFDSHVFQVLPFTTKSYSIDKKWKFQSAAEIRKLFLEVFAEVLRCWETWCLRTFDLKSTRTLLFKELSKTVHKRCHVRTVTKHHRKPWSLIKVQKHGELSLTNTALCHFPLCNLHEPLIFSFNHG